MKNNSNFNQITKLICTIIQLAGFSYIMYILFYISLNNNTEGASTLIAGLLAYLLFYYIHIVLHEGGHLIAGLLSGYKFYGFRVKSFALIKMQNKKYKLKRMQLKGTSGQCLMYYPDYQIGKTPYKFLNLNGGLVNIIIGTITLIIGLTIKDNSLKSCLFQSFGILGLLFGTTNIIPCKIRGIKNDGYNTLELSKNPDTLECHFIALNTFALLTIADTCADFPKDIVTKILKKDFSKSDLSNDFVIGAYLCQADLYYDTGDFEKAYEMQKSIMNNNLIIKVMRIEAQCECLFFALIKGEKENIDKLYTDELKNYIKATLPSPARQRLMYAYYKFYEHNEEEARKCKENLNKLIKTFPYEAVAKYEYEIVSKLESGERL